MGVIKEERDRLDAVMRRYAASGRLRRRVWPTWKAAGVQARPVRCRSIHPAIDATADLRACRPDAVRRAAGRAASSKPYRGAVRGRRRALGRARRRALDRRTVHVRRDGPRRHDRDTSPRRHGSLPTSTTTANVDRPGRRAALGQRDLRRRAAAPHRRPPLPRRSHWPCGTAAPAARPTACVSTSDVTIHGVTRRLEGTLVDLPAGARRRRCDRGSRSSTSVTSTSRRRRC